MEGSGGSEGRIEMLNGDDERAQRIGSTAELA